MDVTNMSGPATTCLRSDDAAARRFPLVPRTKPVCRALDVRVAHVRERALLAEQRTDEPLTHAAEAHNLTALILSDCGMPDLARDVCWRQFDVIRAAGPADTARAKLTLQPLVNLARLHIRDGNGTAAYQLITALFDAIKAQTETVIETKHINFRHFVRAADHREVVQWLWAILLADGTRALSRAGRWSEALHHARRHNGIGQRLFDGRQVAILAHCTAGNHETAQTMVDATSTPTPWEKAVAACLTVLCLSSRSRATTSDIASMIDTYLALETGREDVVFHVRLGLTIINIADGHHRAPHIADRVEHTAHTRDAYAASEALAAEELLALTRDRSQELTEIARASGLGSGSMPADLLADLMRSISLSEAVMTQATAARARPDYHAARQGAPNQDA